MATFGVVVGRLPEGGLDEQQVHVADGVDDGVARSRVAGVPEAGAVGRLDDHAPGRDVVPAADEADHERTDRERAIRVVFRDVEGRVEESGTLRDRGRRARRAGPVPPVAGGREAVAAPPRPTGTGSAGRPGRDSGRRACGRRRPRTASVGSIARCRRRTTPWPTSSRSLVSPHSTRNPEAGEVAGGAAVLQPSTVNRSRSHGARAHGAAIVSPRTTAERDIAPTCDCRRPDILRTASSSEHVVGGYDGATMLASRPIVDVARRRSRSSRDSTATALERVAAGMRSRRFRRGEVIFHVGDPGDALFIIVSGRGEDRAAVRGRRGGHPGPPAAGRRLRGAGPARRCAAVGDRDGARARPRPWSCRATGSAS